MTKWTVFAIQADKTGKYFTGYWKDQFNSDKRRPQTWSRLHDARRVARRINNALLPGGSPYLAQKYVGVGFVQVVPVELRG